MGRLLSLTLFALLVLMWVVLSFTTFGRFWTPINIYNLLRQGALIAILAMGETFVIITAGIDLSVGAIAGFSTVIIAWLLTHTIPILNLTVPIWMAILLTLALGFAIGLFHAFGVTTLGLPPFIMTLATWTALRDVGFLITNGATISITNTAFTGFSRGDFLAVPFIFLQAGSLHFNWLPIPNLFWMVLVVAVPGYIFLHQTRFGRYLFAIGSNREAARLSGVNTTFIVYIAYTMSALCAAFAGILLAARIGIGSAGQGEGWELQAIASSVIGGTSLFGAIGTVYGPVLGSFILATINNGANLRNLNSYWQGIITGLLIIVIVYLDNLRRRKR
jgi:ribose transport system permease protein